MKRYDPARLPLIGLTIAVAAALALGQQSTDPDQQQVPTDTAQQPDAAQQQQPPTIPAEELMPLTERTQAFQIIEGDKVGDRVTQTLRRTRGNEPGQWVLSFNGLNRLYVRRTTGGEIEMVRLDLPRENRAVTYEPAVRLIPATLHPDFIGEVRGLARIYDLETGEQIRTGRYQHELEQVSRASFHTPEGRREGYLIVIDHLVDVDFGEVRLGLEAGYLLGEGMVYRHMRYTIKKLGLFGSTLRRTAVIAEPSSGEASQRSGTNAGNE